MGLIWSTYGNVDMIKWNKLRNRKLNNSLKYPSERVYQSIIINDNLVIGIRCVQTI